MAISEFASGTRTTSGGLEGSPTVIGGASNTTDGIFQLFMDFTQLADGDLIEVRCREKCLSSGSQVVVYAAQLGNAQDEPLMAGPSLILMHGWEFDIRQISGSARSIPWSIRQVA